MAPFVLGSFRCSVGSQHAADVADTFGDSGQRVVCVLLVLKTDVVAVFDLPQGGQNFANIEHAAANFNGSRLRGAAVEVLQVEVVEAGGTLADRFGGVDPAPRGMAHVDAEP